MADAAQANGASQYIHVIALNNKRCQSVSAYVYVVMVVAR